MSIPKHEKYIPPGPYCYHIIDGPNKHGQLSILKCPYWESHPEKPEQMNGYCRFIKKGDWEENGTTLLFDLCKECGIKEDRANSETEANYLNSIIEWGESVLKFIKNKQYRIKIMEWLTKEKTELLRYKTENFSGETHEFKSLCCQDSETLFT